MELDNQDSIQQNRVSMDEKNDRKVGLYVVGFVILLGVIIGILISYMTNISPKKTETKEVATQKEEEIKDISQITENLKKEPEKKVSETAQISTQEKNNQTLPQNNQTVVTNNSKTESNQKNDAQNQSLQDQVQKLKEMLRNRELKIAELEKKLSETKSTKEPLSKLPKISSMVVGECVNYEIGSYVMPRECKDAILKKIKEVKKEPNIIVWEIVPRVDTRAYKGDLPELKQSGLGSYRASSLRSLLKEELGNNELILQSWILQEEDKRGFVLKVYKLEASK